MSDDQGPMFSTQPPGSPDDAPIAGSAAPAPGMRDAMAAWTDLDPSSKLIIGGSAGAILVTIVGLPLGVWASTDFVLMILTASIVAGLAAGLRTGEILATQLGLLELGAGSVLGVLGVWNLIETLFDLDHPRGDLLGIILAIALAAAGVAVLAGAVRRIDDPRELVMHGQWTKVTAIGFALVLVGWTLNLTIGYWTMGQAGLSLAVLTLAALIIVVSDRIESPIPAAWAGVVLGVFAALLALGQWGDLMNLGQRTSLGPIDYLTFLAYVAGIVAIIGGGVMTALDEGARKASSGEIPA